MMIGFDLKVKELFRCVFINRLLNKRRNVKSLVKFNNEANAVQLAYKGVKTATGMVRILITELDCLMWLTGDCLGIDIKLKTLSIPYNKSFFHGFIPPA